MPLLDSTTTGLPNATTPLTGSERVPMDQAGTTVDAAVSDIATYVGGIAVGAQGAQGSAGAQGAQGAQGSGSTPGPPGVPGASTEVWVDLGTGTTFAINGASNQRAFRINPSGNFTITFINMPGAPIVFRAVIEFDNAAGFTGTYPSGYSWGAGAEPTWSAAIDLVTVYSRDGGTTSRWMISSPGA